MPSGWNRGRDICFGDDIVILILNETGQSKSIYVSVKETGERDSVFGSPGKKVMCIGMYVVSGLRIGYP